MASDDKSLCSSLCNDIGKPVLGMQDGIEDAARILKARWHGVLRLASRGTLAGDSLRPCLTSPPGQFSTNVPSAPTKPGRTASPPMRVPTTRPLSARAASADWTAEWARMPEYADRRPTAWPGGLSAPGTLSFRAGWCRGLFRSYSGPTSRTRDSRRELSDRSVLWLTGNRVLLPGISTLSRLVAEVHRAELAAETRRTCAASWRPRWRCRTASRCRSWNGCAPR